MRVTRGAASAVIPLLAAVLLIVSLVLCITLILLPLGVRLMFLAIRLYGDGLQLRMPRLRWRSRKPRGVRQIIRKRFGLRPRGSGSGGLKRAGKRAGGAGRDLGKRAHGMKRDDGKRTGGVGGTVHGWSRRAGEALPGRRPHGSGSGDLKQTGKRAGGAKRDLGK
jgi:hypothetical protein